MLQTFNLPGKNISPDKQMSMMRTYLNQLKDEMESELYNIRWENLSKDLQDKLTSLEKYSADTDEKVNAISANFVSTDYLAANYATIGSLNAVSAAIGSLEAIAITTQNLSAQTIQGSQITGLTINANQITSGKIKASQIDADDIASTSFSGLTVKTNRVTAAHGITIGAPHNSAYDLTMYVDYFLYNGYRVSWKSETINGTTINYLGR